MIVRSLSAYPHGSQVGEIKEFIFKPSPPFFSVADLLKKVFDDEGREDVDDDEISRQLTSHCNM